MRPAPGVTEPSNVPPARYAAACATLTDRGLFPGPERITDKSRNRIRESPVRTRPPQRQSRKQPTISAAGASGAGATLGNRFKRWLKGFR